MRRVLVTDQPLLLGVDPGVQPLVEDQLHGLLGRRGIERVALDDREIGIDEHAAVEAGDGALQRERLDQHAHAARRPAAGDGEHDAGIVQRTRRRLRRLGQHLVLGDQRAVHVRQQKADVALPAHCFRSD